MNTLPIILLSAALAGAGTVETETERSYSDDDVWYLSRVIQAESGYCQREMMEGVGSVVLNRVADDRFPNSIPEVIQQPGQYSTLSWLSSQTPTEEVMEVTIDLLENGSKFPPEVVWQANFPQGSGTYQTLSTSYSTMYFCY
jgi:N-acetylmuramoyl-L-alanine amidase